MPDPAQTHDSSGAQHFLLSALPKKVTIGFDESRKGL
jgi:hypothetical protein